MFYLILLNYVRPLTEVDRHIDAHREFLKRHYDAGHFLLSGRKEPRSGGVILAKAACPDDVARWVSEDPFQQAGIATYEIARWVPTMAAEGWPFDSPAA